MMGGVDNCDRELQRRVAEALELVPVPVESMLSRLEVAIDAETAETHMQVQPKTTAGRDAQMELVQGIGRVIVAVLRSLVPGILVDPLELALATTNRESVARYKLKGGTRDDS